MAVDAALLIMALFWAANMIALKWLLGALPPSLLSSLRFSLVACIGLGVLAVRCGPFTVARRDVPRLLLSAFTGITLYQVLFMEGLDRSTAFVSNLLQGTEPLWALILLSLTGATVLRRQWAGVLVAFLGAILFFLQDVGRGFTMALGRGDLLNLASAASFAVYGLACRPLFERYPGRTIMALSMSLGALPLVVWSGPELQAFDWASLTPQVWGALAFSSVLPVYVGYWIWNWAITKKGLAHASLYIFVDIILSGVASYLFLGERFGLLRLAGASIILAGVRLAR
jgi:drug/metabolite transporter (DMT)-like permease